MGLTTRPTKNIDLTKIDEIQDEFFSEKTPVKSASKKLKNNGSSDEKNRTVKKSISKPDERANSIAAAPTENTGELKTEQIESKTIEPENQKIADLLAKEKVKGTRFVSRPYTVPRSLTIDLTRLKSKFRTRDLQYTQNELMDKMIRESLEIVSAENYLGLRETALNLIKSPEQCSRRSVTLTEETVSGMAELKADLALANNRRFSGDEIFTTLLAIAFATLYENGLL